MALREGPDEGMVEQAFSSATVTAAQERRSATLAAREPAIEKLKAHSIVAEVVLRDAVCRDHRLIRLIAACDALDTHLSPPGRSAFSHQRKVVG